MTEYFLVYSFENDYLSKSSSIDFLFLEIRLQWISEQIFAKKNLQETNGYRTENFLGKLIEHSSIIEVFPKEFLR